MTPGLITDGKDRQQGFSPSQGHSWMGWSLSSKQQHVSRSMVNCGAIIQEVATLSSNEIQMTFRNRFTFHL
jgi:hypothetical protein